MRNEVRVNANGYISLNWRKNKKHNWFLAEEDEDGRIVLTPANLVPAIVRETSPSGQGVIEAIRDLGFPERT